MSKTKKNRLDESQVRRFMGLANLHPLGEGFLDRIREEDDLPPDEGAEGLPPEGEEMPPEEPLPGEGEEAGPPTEDTAAAATEMAQDVADAVATALSDALGQHGVEVTSGEAEGGGEEAALPGEEAALPGEEEGLPGEEEGLPGEEELPPEEELEELEAAGIEVVNDDRLVQEVARRVAARLLKESKVSPRSKAAPKKTRTRRTRRR